MHEPELTRCPVSSHFYIFLQKWIYEHSGIHNMKITVFQHVPIRHACVHCRCAANLGEKLDSFDIWMAEWTFLTMALKIGRIREISDRYLLYMCLFPPKVTGLLVQVESYLVYVTLPLVLYIKNKPQSIVLSFSISMPHSCLGEPSAITEAQSDDHRYF